MGWSKKDQYEYKFIYNIIIWFLIEYKGITCHWVRHTKIKPSDVDKCLKQINISFDSTFRINGPTYKLFVEEDITEETFANHDEIYKEDIVNLEDVPNQPDKVNDKI